MCGGLVRDVEGGNDPFETTIYEVDNGISFWGPYIFIAIL
jgi:hypothetical protein